MKNEELGMQNSGQPEHGKVLIYRSADGQDQLEVHLGKDTVWLTLNQMADLFERDKSVISRHLRTIFSSGELDKEGTVAKNATVQMEGDRKVARNIEWYNLDAIISVGYRVNSLRGTQFRIWATNVLKQHLIQGYTVNQRRLAEKGLSEMEQAVALLSRTLQRHELVTDEGKAILEVVSRYARSWSLLLQYDEDRLALPKDRHDTGKSFDYHQVLAAITTTSTPASRKKRPIFSTSSSRTTPSATATSASARSSSCSSCVRMNCWRSPASTRTAWSPWPC